MDIIKSEILFFHKKAPKNIIIDYCSDISEYETILKKRNMQNIDNIEQNYKTKKFKNIK